MKQFHSKAELAYLDSVNRQLAESMSLAADLRAVSGRIVSFDFVSFTAEESAWFRAPLFGQDGSK